MTKRTPLGVWCVLLMAFITISALFSYARGASDPVSAGRITQQIDESKVVRLAGNTRPEANIKNDRGPVSDVLDIDHMFLLLQRSPEKEQELDRLIDSLNDRNSPNFHHWLTPEEFGDRFGVAQEDIDKVTNWLESHGFRINYVYPNKMLIDISGTAGQLRSAFGSEIHQLDIAGETHLANINDPHVPAALAPVVKGFASLNDFKPEPMYRLAKDYTFAGCTGSTGPGSCYAITPQDDQTIYNLNPLYSAGYSGQGQTIALVEDTDTYGGAADWNTYRTTFGLNASFPLGTYSQVHPGGCTDPGTNAADGEAAIDVEVASAIAPSAAIELISCADTTFTFGGLTALQNLINTCSGNSCPGVVSVSYGVCEADNGTGGNAAFYNTYQQAASQGISVFVSSGDAGASGCSRNFSVGSEYDVTSLGVSGWGETPYNVSVGGTDFEDTYNAKEASVPLSTYWNSTNSTYYGSAKQYIPEIPWNDACASVLISFYLTGSFTPYGASPATCNNSSYDTSTTFLSTGAASGGPSNCAVGAAGTNQSSYLISQPQCQGYAKPSWQSAYGVPNDGVRDTPDVSMFAANGVWGHFETVCWSDPSQTSGGAASCSGAPSTWSGFGGTSVASPTMAAIQALVNQKTGEKWGNPNPIYYQIAQGEYGTQGGSFLGAACNSSRTGGPAAGCAFNDVTQGDIDVACEDNGSTEEAHCYKPAGTYGVDSTDNVTQATIINGGTGYTSAPTCTIAGPSNAAPYKSPTGTTLWTGGTQATCTASVNSGTTNAVWTVKINAAPGSATTGVWPSGGASVTVGGTTYTFVTSLTGTPYSNAVLLVASGTTSAQETGTAKNLEAAINNTSSQCSASPCFANVTGANASATATESTSTVTLTAKTGGYAGNFSVSWGTGFEFGAGYIVITNTTLGQGPNYVSGIAITSAGSGYQPETPITLTGGGGSGAIAVANTSIGTAAQSYQPAWGAAPGYDLATGLGTPNAYNLVCSSAWGSTCQQSQTITVTTAPPSSAVYGSTFPVAATASSGLTPAFTASGGCSVVDNGNGSATYTMTSGVSSCSVIINQAGNGSYSAAPTVTDSVSATQAVLTVSANNASMNYGDAAFPSFSANITGYTNGDSSSVVSGAPSFSTNATLSSTPGQYTLFVTQGTLAATNYTFTFINAFLNIGQATPTATLAANPGTIGTGDSTTLTATVTGSPNGVAPTGNVTFYLGQTVLGTGCLGGCTPQSEKSNHRRMVTEAILARGRKTLHGLGPEYPGVASTATLVVSGTTLSLGANSITATYAGDTNYVTEPTNGSTVNVDSPGLYAPANSTLTGNTATFSWYGWPGATAYWIDIGNVLGGNQYYQSGSLPTTTESVNVNSLPLDGSTVYVTLYYFTNGSWVSNAYTFTAYNNASNLGVITSPAPNSNLTGSSVPFTWTAGSTASAYWIDAGSSPGGNQYFQSGNLGNVLTTTVSNLPITGGTVYVTLYSLVSGQWLNNAYVYTAFNQAAAGGVITSPTPGATLGGPTQTFVWSPGTGGATNYWLDVGSTPGGNQYEQSGALGDVTTTTVSGLPTDGSPVYVTLYSLIGGVWSANAYTYTAFSASTGLAVMQTPTPSTTLSGSQQTFTWSAGSGATAYWLDIGSGPGGNQYYQSGNLGSALTTTVYSLPADGSTIYVTLYSYVGGQWLNNAYTYTSGQ